MTKKYILIIFFLTGIGISWAVPPKPIFGKIIYDFSDDWQVFSSRHQTYIPHSVSGSPSVNSISLKVQANEYRGYHLVFSINEKMYFYINARLSGTFEAGQNPEFNIDSLLQVSGKKQFFFTFYNPDGQISLPEAYIIYKTDLKNQLSDKKTNKEVLDMTRRSGIVFHDFSILTSVLILLSFAFLWNVHPNLFSEYYNLNKLFLGKITLLKSMSRIQALFILHHALILAFAWMLWQKLHHQENSVFFTSQTLPDLFQTLFFYTSIAFLLIFSKYLSVLVLASLLRTEKYIHSHFYVHLSASMIFYSVLTGLLFWLQLESPVWQPDLFPVLFRIILGFHALRIAWIAFNLNKLQGFRNVYLFSYLCATELLPALLGFRFLSQALI